MRHPNHQPQYSPKAAAAQPTQSNRTSTRIWVRIRCSGWIIDISDEYLHTPQPQHQETSPFSCNTRAGPTSIYSCTYYAIDSATDSEVESSFTLTSQRRLSTTISQRQVTTNLRTIQSWCFRATVRIQEDQQEDSSFSWKEESWKLPLQCHNWLHGLLVEQSTAWEHSCNGSILHKEGVQRTTWYRSGLSTDKAHRHRLAISN
jgi:hypothetical protein